MKHLTFSILGMLLIATPNPFRAAGKAQPTAALAKEEYAVYVAVINKRLEGEKAKLIVIKDHTAVNHFTSGAENWQHISEKLLPLSQETIEDYKVKNKESSQLKHFDLKSRYVLVKKKEMDGIFKGGPKGWEEFYKKYPDSGGYISFSRVGFNPEMNQALVYVEHGCGGLCGTGNYILLSKEDGIWKVVKQHMAWVS